MTVPITSSIYGYTKVLVHNLNSKKHQVLLLAEMDAELLLLLFFLLNSVVEHVRAERGII